MKRGVDYIGVGVGALILDDEGKVFLARRGPQAKNERGTWECPGGAVEFGETCAESLRREIREEHDIEIEVLELLQLCDHIIPEEQQHWVAPTYICRIVSGEPKIMEPEKCDAMGWFAPEEALQLPLAITTQGDIRRLLERRGSAGSH